MKDIYATLKSTGEAEFEEKKSRFIGCAAPVSTEEEALAFIKEVKNKYKKARHYVYAYSLCSEDGVVISRYPEISSSRRITASPPWLWPAVHGSSARTG